MVAARGGFPGRARGRALAGAAALGVHPPNSAGGGGGSSTCCHSANATTTLSTKVGGPSPWLLTAPPPGPAPTASSPTTAPPTGGRSAEHRVAAATHPAGDRSPRPGAPTRRQRPPREGHHHAQISTSGPTWPSGPARPDHWRARVGSDRAGRPRAARRRRHGFHPGERRRSPARRTVRPRGGRHRPQRVRRRSGAVADHRVVARHRGRRQWWGLRVHRRAVRVVVEHPAVEQQLDGRRVLRDGGRRRRRHGGVAARPRRLGRRRDGESRRAHVGVRRRPRGALRHRRERGLRRVVGRVATAVVVRWRRIHPSATGCRRLRREDVPRRRQPVWRHRRPQARPRHRNRQRLGRRVLGPPQRLRDGAADGSRRRPPARHWRRTSGDGVGHARRGRTGRSPARTASRSG